MKAFWASVIAAIALAAISATVLTTMDYSTADVYRSRDVRL